MSEFDANTLWEWFQTQDSVGRRPTPGDTNYLIDSNDDELIDSNEDHIIYQE